MTEDELRWKIEWYEEALRTIAEGRVPVSTTTLYVPTHVRIAQFARAALEGGPIDEQNTPNAPSARDIRPPVRTRRKS